MGEDPAVERTSKSRRLVITGVTLTERQLERLDAVARQERRSRSFLVRDAVSLFLTLREREAR
jgi:metal-responsive CopG/Arc/MetJ family transcriptional regulator